MGYKKNYWEQAVRAPLDEGELAWATGEGEMTHDGELALESFIPYQLAVLSANLSRSLAKLYNRQFDIGIPEWRCIAVLGRFAPLSANEVCEKSSMDKVQVSRTIARLTKAGLVERKTDEDDRRRSVLTLTDQGKEVHSTIVPMAKCFQERFLRCFNDDEREDVLRLMDRMMEVSNDLVGEYSKRFGGPDFNDMKV